MEEEEAKSMSLQQRLNALAALVAFGFVGAMIFGMF